MPDVNNAVAQTSTVVYEDGRQYLVTCKFGFYIPYNGHLVCNEGEWQWLMDNNGEAIECRPGELCI